MPIAADETPDEPTPDPVPDYDPWEDIIEVLLDAVRPRSPYTHGQS